jgi:hypothetical protein
MPARSRIARPLAVALSVASVAIAAPVRAQDATVATTPAPDSVPKAPTPANTTAPSGPSIEAAAVGVRRAASESSAESAQRRRAGYGQPMALMVVGGAAVLVGLIIGGGAGTVIAVAGAIAGLYGLYQYLQ